MAEFKIRMLYRHEKGRIFYVIGIAEDENKNTVVIMSHSLTGKVYTRPIEQFAGDKAVYKLIQEPL